MIDDPEQYFADYSDRYAERGIEERKSMSLKLIKLYTEMMSMVEASYDASP